MKKYLFLIILLCIMFFPKDTFALEYTVNNNCIYNVDSPESLRDYYYFNNVVNSNIKSYSLLRNINNITYCVMSTNEDGAFYNSSFYGFKTSPSSSFTGALITCYDSSNSYELTPVIDNFQSNRLFSSKFELLYFSRTFIDSDSSRTEPNFSFTEITDKYDNLSCSDVPVGPDEPENPEMEVSDMFDLCIVMLQRFVSIIPVLIVVYLVLDITGSILLGKR